MKDNPVAARGSTTSCGALFELLHGLRLEGRENSFKMSDATLLADRCLLGVHKADISPARLLSACEKMEMPQAFLAEVKERAPDANAFHFGFEGRPGGGLCKVYLEFASRLVSGGSEPVLLHLAYKWDCHDTRKAMIARYVCHPGLARPAILAKLARLYAGTTDTDVLEIVQDIVAAAGLRCSEPPMYLEVSEEGNPRASFDIKLHDTGMRVGDIGACLERLRGHYAIAADLLGPLLARVADTKLGHVSGGINREGRDFLTVYYVPDSLG